MDAFRPQQSHGFLGKGGRYGGHHGNAVIPAAIHRSAPGKLFHAMNDQGVGALLYPGSHDIEGPGDRGKPVALL